MTRQNTMQNKFLPFLLVLTLLALTSGCAKSPTGRNQLMLVSPETAISASKEAYINTIKPLAADGKIDNNPLVRDRVQKITGRLVHEAIEMYPYTEAWEWTIKIIDDDRIGIELAARAGYAPRAAVTLWQKMGAIDGSRFPEFLSTHLSPANRQETLNRLGPEMMPYYTEKKTHLIYVF